MNHTPVSPTTRSGREDASQDQPAGSFYSGNAYPGNAHPDLVAEAFGRKAEVYDAFGRDHPNLDRMRAKVRRQVERLLPAGARLLEINAGTGADAAYFAGRGYRVHATDLSAGMVARIRTRSAAGDYEGRLTTQQLSFTELEEAAGGLYQGVFSNMGGVNCAADLTAITRGLQHVLEPGGVLVWVVMPPLCLWELAQALRGELGLAGRRLRPNGTLARVEGLPVWTYYYSPRQVRAALGPQFHPLSLQGLSVFTPPADHKEFAHRRPRLYRLLAWLDERLADRFPFHSLGDFYILSLRYLPETASGARPGSPVDRPQEDLYAG
jgi:SAM-dependent methyltransferase